MSRSHKCQPGCTCGKHRGGPLSEAHKKAISEGQKRRHAEAQEKLVGKPDRKKCNRCLTWKPVTEFYTSTRRLADGSIRKYPSGECKTCARIRRRSWYDSKSPEERREMNRRYYESRDQDSRRQYQREYQATQRRRQGIPLRGPWKRYRESGFRMVVPVGPFVAWMKANYPNQSLLAEQMGIDESRLRVLERGSYTKNGKTYPVENIGIDFVDRALVAAGGTTHLRELYPHLYE